jgi:hypothetical protein
MNDGELGDSEGERRRMETVEGSREVVRVNKCRIGLKMGDGIEWVSVGDNDVGESYLEKRSETAAGL